MSLDRRIRVAELFVDRQGRWVSGVEIATPEIGGSEGLRRVRELRSEGWPIEKRSKRGSEAYEYRLPIRADFE